VSRREDQLQSETAGTSITLSRLDDEITGLLAAPAEIAIRTF